MEATSNGHLRSGTVPLHAISDRQVGRPFRELPWKAKLSFTFSVLVGLAWLAPMMTLLWLNFTNHVVGARVPCLHNECVVNDYSDLQAYSNLEQYEMDSHDTDGALQLLAKALEIYFVYMAGSLVWMVARLLLQSRSGLPAAYLMRHVECGDILTMREPTFWTALRRPKGPGGLRRRDMRSVYLFVFLCAIPVTIIASLMGPAVAVLLIPTQQSLDAPQLPQQQFLRLLVGDAPTSVSGCSGAQLSARRYSCAAAAYGSVVDSLSESYDTALDQLIPYYQTSDNRLTSTPWLTFERQLSFTLNTTYNIRDLERADESDLFQNVIGWAPNRQLIRELANDAQAFINDTPLEFKTALQSSLERTGPILGFRSALDAVLLSNTVIGSTRDIRCYWEPNNDWRDIAPDTTGVCFRSGSGWADFSSSEAGFRVNDTRESSTSPVVAADIFYVDDVVSLKPARPINSSFGPTFRLRSRV